MRFRGITRLCLCSHADIDECTLDYHVCADNCHNSVGSYSCSCDAGYRLNSDGRNCDGEYRKTWGSNICPSMNLSSVCAVITYLLASLCRN